MVDVTLFLNEKNQSKFDMGFSTAEITEMARQSFGHRPEDGYIDKRPNLIWIETPQFAQVALEDRGLLPAYVLSFSPADEAFDFPGGGSSGELPTDKIGAIRWSSHYNEWGITIAGFSLTFDEMAALAKQDKLIPTILAGDDTFSLDVGDDVVPAYGGNDVVNDFGGSNTLRGGGGNDTLKVWDAFGSEDFETNRLFGDAGKDTLTGASGDDSLSGGKGADVLDGAFGKDQLNGDAGNDTLVGGLGNDVLNGGGGKDLLSGSGGADRLTGGAGADTFVFAPMDSTNSAKNRDTITDFSPKSGDVIDLSIIDANANKLENQAFKFIGDNDFHGKAGELRYKIGGSDTFIYTDTDGDGKADQSIRLDDAMKLTAADFIL